MTRRALPAHRVIPVHREIAFNLGREKIAKIGRKNDHSSKSVCSFDAGIIFPGRLRHDISRKSLGVSILFPEETFLWRKYFLLLQNFESRSSFFARSTFFDKNCLSFFQSAMADRNAPRTPSLDN